jgi:CHAT domain-containing protein
MKGFYKNLLAGMGRVETLRKAKLELKQKHSSPYYCGGFICQGKNEPIELV